MNTKIPLNDEQEVYEFVGTHLLGQLKRSLGGVMTEDGYVESCVFRGDNNLSCAVGCLFNLDFRVRYLEGQGVDSADVQLALGSPSVDVVALLGLLQQLLQQVHDTLPPAQWRDGLRGVARVSQLDSSWMAALDA